MSNSAGRDHKAVGYAVKSLFAFLVVLLFTGMNACAAEERMEASEYAIKAAYLYNFLLFITWPEPPADHPCIIGIVGSDPFKTAFEKIEGAPLKTTGQRLEIQRFVTYGGQPGLRSCTILFIAASEKKHFEDIVAHVRGAPVLTVADTPGFLDTGGMFNFVTVEDKIRWEVNRPPLEKAGLRPSAQLLQSAVKVMDTELQDRRSP